MLVLVPVQHALPYDQNAEEVCVTCDKCRLEINIRMWAHHIESEW